MLNTNMGSNTAAIAHQEVHDGEGVGDWGSSENLTIPQKCDQDSTEIVKPKTEGRAASGRQPPCSEVILEMLITVFVGSSPAAQIA